ncbi:MAG: Hsp20/alpha crystallin family protein [Nitrospirae bacterium]|nr:Hsp20/alpha crystallin family protein [Nitrospirota bacterium]
MRNDDFIGEVDRFHREIERFFSGFFSPHHPLHLLSEGKWRPPTDVYEVGDKLVFKMELAGVAGEGISVSVEDRTLRVRGVRKHAADSGVTYHQMEINYGEFERSMVLPETRDAKNVQAEYKEGFLYVTITLQRGK